MSYIFLAPAPPLVSSVFPPSATHTPPHHRSRALHCHCTAARVPSLHRPCRTRALCHLLATIAPSPAAPAHLPCRRRLHLHAFRAAVAIAFSARTRRRIAPPQRHLRSHRCRHRPLRRPRVTAPPARHRATAASLSLPVS
jgi:hypothetical protein